MPLVFQSRRVGQVTVVTCEGRIVAGEETATFETYLDEIISFDPVILLHLGAVDFIDSAGLGLLVRYHTRAKNASGALRICAVSPAVDRVLTVSRLKPVLQTFDDEGHALVEAHRAGADTFTTPDILCVDESEDVLAYLRELLRNDGRRAMTASNLPDALILLRATQPRVVVVGAAMRALRTTRSAEDFHRLTATRPVVELPEGFASQDAGEAARRVLDAIRECSV